MEIDKHFGTKAVGYVQAKFGPFECSRCSHFVESVHGCVHPEVMADKEIKQHRSGAVYAIVEPKGCCNEWYPEDKK